MERSYSEFAIAFLYLYYVYLEELHALNRTVSWNARAFNVKYVNITEVQIKIFEGVFVSLITLAYGIHNSHES